MKDIPVLGLKADREQADAEQEQQPDSHSDQHPAGRFAAPSFPGIGRKMITLVWHRA
jgi:hypothetical protein